MADQREVAYGLRFQIDDSGITAADRKLNDLSDTAADATEKTDQIGTTLKSVGTSASQGLGQASQEGKRMGTTVTGAMNQSTQAGTKLGKTVKSELGTSLTDAGKKAKQLGKDGKESMDKVGTAIKQPADRIKGGLNPAIEKGRKQTKGLGDEADKAGTKLKHMGTQGDGAGTRIARAAKRIIAAFAAASVITTAIGWIKDFSGAAISAAAAAEETQSKFEVVFGSSAEATLGWAENFSTAAHRSKNEIKGFLADSQAIFTGLGMADSAAADMSKTVTSLSYDLASFNNISDQDAFVKLRSGLLGEAEGLKSIGVILNDSALKSSMQGMGLGGDFKDLNEASKVQVRLNAVLAQTATAQTDVTRTSDSYTNSLKGVQGIWQDFLADAGTRFTPVLTGLFNTIIEAWPTIEPMLMGLVDLLGDGLADAIPILITLGQQLLPILVQAVGTVFSVLQPVIPILGSLLQTLLPPLISILDTVCGVLLPPLITLLEMINVGILQPLMPMLAVLVDALLPPIVMIIQAVMDVLAPLMPIAMQLADAVLPVIVSLLGVIAPILQMLSPILEFIVGLVGKLVEVLAGGLSWISKGIGSAVSWFGDYVDSAQGVTDATDELGASMESAGGVRLAAPDLTEVSTSFSADLPAAATQGWGEVAATSGTALGDIGTTTDDTYSAMASSSDAAWSRMVETSKSGVKQIQQQIGKLTGVDITMGVSYKGAGGDIPHNAGGTPSFGGGWTHINEQGGELAYLPGGSAIVPADKTDRILSRSGGGGSKTVNVEIHITVDGSTSAPEKAEIARIAADEARKAVRGELDNRDTNERIQDGYYDLEPA